MYCLIDDAWGPMSKSAWASLPTVPEHLGAQAASSTGASTGTAPVLTEHLTVEQEKAAGRASASGGGAGGQERQRELFMSVLFGAAIMLAFHYLTQE